jgi:hypothetical protein
MQCTTTIPTVPAIASLMAMFAFTAGLASAAEQRVLGVHYSSGVCRDQESTQ